MTYYYVCKHDKYEPYGMQVDMGGETDDTLSIEELTDEEDVGD